MSTTVKNATLKITLREDITLNGSKMSSENVLRISDINEVFKRIITLTGGGQVTVVSLNNTLAAGGTYREGDVRYTKADIQPLRDLGWDPKYTIEKGIHNCFRRLKNEII